MVHCIHRFSPRCAQLLDLAGGRSKSSRIPLWSGVCAATPSKVASLIANWVCGRNGALHTQVLALTWKFRRFCTRHFEEFRNLNHWRGKFVNFTMSSMRFLAVKWGFKARHRGDDHAYSVISSSTHSCQLSFVFSKTFRRLRFLLPFLPHTDFDFVIRVFICRIAFM